MVLNFSSSIIVFCLSKVIVWDPNKQYIIYDTYIDRTDNKSMIGATINFNKNRIIL